MNALKTIILSTATVLTLSNSPAFALNQNLDPAPVRARLERMATQLEAQYIHTQAGKRALTRADLADYLTIKPWGMWFHSEASNRPERSYGSINAKEAWPTASDAPALRTLLTDPQPAVRALAVDALASLNLIEDIPRIATLLSDTAPASAVAPSMERISADAPQLWPIRTENIRLQADARIAHLTYQGSYVDFKPPAPSQAVALSWRRSTVAHAASAALLALTQEATMSSITAAEFNAWWQRNSDAQNSLWYWKKRINANPKSRLELRAASPEIEAKVQLLYPVNLNKLSTPGFSSTFELRLSEARLMDLLENPHQWEEPVSHKNRTPKASEMSEAVFLISNGLTALGSPIANPRNAARIKAVMDKYAKVFQNDFTASIARNRLLIALSRSQSNEQQRDALLRQSSESLNGGDGTELLDVIHELLRVSLPAQSAHLRDQLYYKYNPQLGGRHSKNIVAGLYEVAITSALHELPISRVHRQFICDLLLDDRFEQKLSEGHGVPAWFVSAMEGLNRQSGSKSFDVYSHKRAALFSPVTAAQSLLKLRAEVKIVRDTKP